MSDQSNAARAGEITVDYSARNIPRYTVEIWHDGLNKHKAIRDGDIEILRHKAAFQMLQWDSAWREQMAKRRAGAVKATEKQQIEDNKAEAASRTDEAAAELAALEGLLSASLNSPLRVDWDSAKDTRPFSEPRPVHPALPSQPTILPIAVEPRILDRAFDPKFTLLQKLIPSLKARRLAEVAAAFEKARSAWQFDCDKINSQNEAAIRRHEAIVKRQLDAFAKTLEEWEARRAAFEADQARHNEIIDRKHKAYHEFQPEAITEFFELVLSRSSYPDYFPQEWELEFDAEKKLLVLDYTLPAPEALPKVKSVKYVASRDVFEEQQISEAAASKLYDEAIYQVVLRTINELFSNDSIGALETIVFNGIVTSIDRSTGHEVTSCILSLQAQHDEFKAVNLAQVQPKVCFKALKGVGSSKMHGLTPVAPIMSLSREDSRFVSAYGVVDSLSDATNLAAMDWEDFEHLIREVFSKEFSSSGGDVKVTQASRDGGVDAVAFDPDPIRGGKIVIQAKRYTNTVGVSAVRDLYGTVLNEGATKGVLVTTSDFGPDSYAFANGKPLVLLSGSNLLHMLEKHGHRARIDLREAKLQAAQQ